MFHFENKHFDDTKENRKFIYEYVDNMKIYLKKNIPNISDEKLDTVIKEIILKKIKSPNVNFTNKIEGADVELRSMPLLEFTDMIKDDIITPSGSIFCTSDVEQSVFTDYILIKKKERKKVKKEMIHFKEIKESFQSLLKHYDQLSIKVSINAISGVMCSSIFFRSLNCYNSITSSVRHSIMLGYAFIEKLMEANLYLEDENDAINFITNTLRISPNDTQIEETIKEYNLKIPSTKDLEDYIIPGIYTSINTSLQKNTSLKKYIKSLTDTERVFVYYTQNFKHLFWNNDFDSFFEGLFDIRYNINELMKNEKYNNTESLYVLNDKALFTLSMVIQSKIFKNKTVDEIDIENKEAKCILKYTYYHLEDTLSKISNLFNTYIFVPLNLHKPLKHVNMIRKCVILSDTDSIIFTTIKWILRYTGKIDINQKSLNYNSTFVYITSKFLDYIFCVFSKGANVEIKNLDVVNMKNEFFFSSLLRTAISKHYAALIKMQEGIILPIPEFEFKGKNFKGSDLTPDTLKVISNFAKFILNSIEKEPNLNFSTILDYIIEHELTVFNNLKERKTDYLPQKPIKDKSEYKVPYSSNWFYYDLWQSVFSTDYTDIIIPQKCKSVSLKHKIKFSTMDRLSYLEDMNPALYNRFGEFLSKHKKKEITQIIFPPGISIPRELIPIINYKKIIYSQSYGIYLILRSFGLGPIEFNDKKFLISEIYSNVIFE